MKKLIIAACTFYKVAAGLRFSLACQMVRKATESGFTFVIVDGSPDPEVTKVLVAEGAHVIRESGCGMGAAKRQVALECLRMGADVMMLTEPERPDLIRFVDTVTAPVLRGEADVVIVGRTSQSFETYPEHQRVSEMEGNRRYNEVCGTGDVDAYFGPVVFCQPEIRRFIDFNPNNFGAPDTYIHTFVPILSRKFGAKVASIKIDFIYDPAQKSEEEAVSNDEIRKKRIMQLDTVSHGVYVVARHSFHRL